MSATNDGGPIVSTLTLGNDGAMVPVGGLSKREWFAGMALQGYLSCAESGTFRSDSITFSEMAHDCARIADVMIAELADKGSTNE